MTAYGNGFTLDFRHPAWNCTAGIGDCAGAAEHLAGIEAVGVTGEVSVEARYGPVRIPLYPRPRHLKKKKDETEAEQKKSEENEKKKSGKSGLSLPKDGLDVVRSQARCAISSAT